MKTNINRGADGGVKTGNMSGMTLNRKVVIVYCIGLF